MSSASIGTRPPPRGATALGGTGRAPTQATLSASLRSLGSGLRAARVYGTAAVNVVLLGQCESLDELEEAEDPAPAERTRTPGRGPPT